MSNFEDDKSRMRRTEIQNGARNTRPSGVPSNFVRGGGSSTNSVEDGENGDLGAVAPYSGVLD